MAGGGRQKAYAYLRGQKRLIKSILATVHLTSGMPGRGSEIGRMQWVNTIGNKRNVFVYNGQIILVFPDNKATTNHDNSFYIVRNPCSSAQRASSSISRTSGHFASFSAASWMGTTTKQVQALFSSHDTVVDHPTSCPKTVQRALCLLANTHLSL